MGCEPQDGQSGQAGQRERRHKSRVQFQLAQNAETRVGMPDRVAQERASAEDDQQLAAAQTRVDKLARQTTVPVHRQKHALSHLDLGFKKRGVHNKYHTILIRLQHSI